MHDDNASRNFVTVGAQVINLQLIKRTRGDMDRLTVHFADRSFLRLKGQAARLLYFYLLDNAEDLEA